MQVVKIVGWMHLLKQTLLMSDMTLRGVISLADSASLIPYLVIIVMIDLEVMNFGLDVAIKQHAGCVRMALFS